MNTDYERLCHLATDGDPRARSELSRERVRRGMSKLSNWCILGFEQPDSYMNRTGKGYTTTTCLSLLGWLLMNENYIAGFVTHHRHGHGHACKKRIWNWYELVTGTPTRTPWRIRVLSPHETDVWRRGQRSAKIFYDHFCHFDDLL